MTNDCLKLMLQMVYFIRSGDAGCWRDIADEFNISRRTVFRYLGLLATAGFPTCHKPNVGYRFVSDATMPVAALTGAEAMALAVARTVALVQMPKPLARLVKSGVDKCITAASGNEHVPHGVDAAARFGHSRAFLGQADANPSPMLTLQEAMDSSSRCRLRSTESGHFLGSSILFAPYAFYIGHTDWYVVGEAEDEIIPLRLNCITDIEPSRFHFERPQHWSLDQYRGHAWEIRPEGREYDIQLEFRGHAARSVLARTWHPSQKVCMVSEDHCLFAARVDGLTEISNWLRQFAGSVIVRSPIELRDRYVEYLEQGLSMQRVAFESKPVLEKMVM